MKKIMLLMGILLLAPLCPAQEAADEQKDTALFLTKEQIQQLNEYEGQGSIVARMVEMDLFREPKSSQEAAEIQDQMKRKFGRSNMSNRNKRQYDLVMKIYDSKKSALKQKEAKEEAAEDKRIRKSTDKQFEAWARERKDKQKEVDLSVARRHRKEDLKKIMPLIDEKDWRKTVKLPELPLGEFHVLPLEKCCFPAYT